MYTSNFGIRSTILAPLELFFIIHIRKEKRNAKEFKVFHQAAILNEFFFIIFIFYLSYSDEKFIRSSFF